MLSELSPLLLQHQGKGKTWGLLFDQQDKERIIIDDDIVLTCRHNFTLPWDPRATNGTPWPEGGGMILRLAPYEYLIAGNGIVVNFMKQSEQRQTEEKKLGEDGFADQGKMVNAPTVRSRFQGKRIGIGYINQVRISKEGKPIFIRRDNGDQDHQGRHARISCGEYRILHVKLYEY